MTDVDLVLSVKDNKLQSLIYTLPDARAEEVVACWSDPALSLANDTYWKRGNERYRLHGTTLEIARIERMADFVVSLAAALGKPYAKVADVAARYRVTGIPDWSISMYVNPQSTTAIADEEEVTSFVVFASYDGDAGQREHLLQDIESGTGLAELVRNPHNVPVLRATHNGALFETEQFNGTKLVLNVRTATTR